MREPLGADAAYKRLAELVGKRVEVVTLDGRWFGWLRKLPEVAHNVVAAPGGPDSAGAFALWGARDDVPGQEVPFRVFSLSDVLGVRSMD
jgi:hypothetical protein